MENSHPFMCLGFGRNRPEKKKEGFMDWWFNSRANKKQEPALARTTPMRLEPKTFFANERTFLSWLHMAVRNLRLLFSHELLDQLTRMVWKCVVCLQNLLNSKVQSPYKFWHGKTNGLEALSLEA